MCDKIRELYIANIIFCGSMFFNLFIIPIDFDNLFANLFMWLFQFKYLSIVMPRKLNSSTHSNSYPSICKVGSYIFFCSVQKTMNLDLFTFNLFTFNHVLILDNSLFHSDFVVCMNLEDYLMYYTVLCHLHILLS